MDILIIMHAKSNNNNKYLDIDKHLVIIQLFYISTSFLYFFEGKIIISLQLLFLFNLDIPFWKKKKMFISLFSMII